MGQTHLSLYPEPQERVLCSKEDEKNSELAPEHPGTASDGKMEIWKFGSPLNTPLVNCFGL